MKPKPKTGTTALYVYAIGRQEHLRDLFDGDHVPDAVETGSAVALVTEGDLAAVVSEVPLSHFGEGHFETNLKNPAWAAEKVMRHEKVAEFLSTKVAIVPLRFGVMYSTPDRIREMLSGRKVRLEHKLEELQDREEWGLNIQVDRKTLGQQMSELSPRLAEMSSKAKASSPGQAYLLTKKLDSLRASESRTEIRRIVQSFQSELEAKARATRSLPIREIETKQSPAVVGKISFLLDRKALKTFRAAAEKLAKKYSAFGFSVELTGPWPPYNFSE